MSTKESVLNLLRQSAPNPISGESIAKQLGITRAAVWKAVKSLTLDGYEITSCRSLGYVLCGNGDILCEQGIRAAMSDKYRDLKITVFDTIASTNTYAKNLISSGENSSFLVAAAEQTSGRGRRGKSFYSPKGKGVYFSLALHTDTKISESMLLTIAAAVAVCRVVEKVSGEETGIKWVNDVFCGGKKICGILSEAVCGIETGIIESIVVGIGMNVNARPDDFPEEIRAIAGSVNSKHAGRCEIIARIACELLDIHESLSPTELINEYKSRLFIIGKEIEYTKNGQKYRAVAEDVNTAGNLIVRGEHGTDTLVSGEISLGSAAFTK